MIRDTGEAGDEQKERASAFALTKADALLFFIYFTALPADTW
jgi:hypothetical protein